MTNAMVAIVLKDIKGEIPRRSSRLLPDGFLQLAQNVKLWSGEMRTFNDVLKINKPAKAGVKKSIYRWGAVEDGDASGSITAVANETPVKITSASHGRTTGERIFVTGTGLSIDDATYVITVVDGNNYTLDGSSAAGTAAIGTWAKENGYWFHWLTDVDAVQGPIPGDTTERTYYTGDGVPKMTYSPIAVNGGGSEYPTNSYNLGIPAPTNALTATPATTNGSITGATQANPVKITSSGHGRETGEKINITGVVGMTELNSNDYTLTVVDDDNFTLDNTDGTGYTAYSSGGTWTITGSELEKTSTSYVYTYVSALNEEGPPSPPSSTANFLPGQTIDLSGMDTGPGGSYNIDRKWIYRSALGSDTYQFVAEVVVANTTYSDTKSDSELGNNILTADPTWDEPPTDMHSINVLSNGIGVGASGIDVYVTPAYQMHAWPTDWRMPAASTIVGLGVFDTNIVVCTTTVPAIVTGADPSNLLLTNFNDFKQSCVSKRGIVGLDGFGVVYPSPDGLVAVGIGGPRLVTENYLTRDEWQSYKPSSINGFAHDGRYFGFYDTGSVQGGFIFDPRDGGAGFIRLTTIATGGFKDLLTDSLYIVDSTGDYIQKWDAASTKLTITVKSKTFQITPVNFVFARVFADSYTSMTFKIYADGVLKHTKTVTSNRPFILPDGFTGDEWYIELITTDNVSKVILAETIEDFTKVA